MGLTNRPRWRLTFEPEAGAMNVLRVGKGDTRAIDDAVTLMKSCIRAAMAAGGCRNVVIGVHVDGADCDHEIAGG